MHPILKKIMATGNKAMSAIYRKSNGRMMNKAKGGIPVLILTVPGRKSGQPRSAPVAYFDYQGSYVVVGSAGGMKDDPDWIKNLAATDRAQIQLGEVVSQVSSRIATGEEREHIWREVVVPQAPYFADYENKSGRTLKIGVLAKV